MFKRSAITRKSAAALSIRLVWPFLEIARLHECIAPVERFHSRLGLTQLQLDDPDTRVPLQIAGTLLTELVEELADQSIGLTAAQKLKTEHIGLAEYLARSKNTLGTALISSVQFVRLLCDGVHHSVEIQDDLAFVRVWFDSNVTLPNAAHEFALATQLNCIRRMLRTSELAPQEAHFMHPTPTDLTLHERLFGCTLRFSMPFTQLVLPASAMELPLPGSEPALCRLLEEQAQHTLAIFPSSKSIVPRVRNLLAAELSLGTATSKHIAQRLGISSRTLARRLKKENTNYQLLFDQTRKDLALRDLTHTPRAISDIAQRLGFASSQSFHRAFRRWTGSTVTSYRKSSRRRLSV